MEFFVRKTLPVSTVVGFLMSVVQKGGQGRKKPSFVIVQDSGCRPVRVRRYRIVSSAVLWRLLSCGPLHLFCPFFLRFSRKRLKLSCLSKSRVSHNGKRFVVWRRAKETINGGSYGFHRRRFVISAIFLPRIRMKTPKNNHSVLLLTFLQSVLKTWCHQD